MDIAAQTHVSPTAPSLRRRLSRFVLALALGWVGVATVGLWLFLHHEINELLDDGLVSTTEALAWTMRHAGPLGTGDAAPAPAGAAPAATGEETQFAWQVLDAQGRVIGRSPNAPLQPLARSPGQQVRQGFGEEHAGAPGWRVRVRALGDGRWLLVGQEARERFEAALEVAGGTIVVALVVSLAGLAWLRRRLNAETRPLADLAEVLGRYDPLRANATLPPPALAELVPVHEAVRQLGERLAQHAAAERAFSAHAAHALRTPLAGLEAQLAAAQHEAPALLQPRLARLRSASSRLSRVVGALLALFRSGGEPERARIDVAALLARVPLEGLAAEVVEPAARPAADEDLLAAALINLLDNALRHGARAVRVHVHERAVTITDDGPGVSAERLRQLREAIERPDDAPALHEGALAGLGLALADRVARAHGGRLELLEVASGFGVRLWLAPPQPLPALTPAPTREASPAEVSPAASS